MCDVCQIPNVVFRSFGLNQYAIDFAHGGNPIPCAHMFIVQNPMKNGIVADNPKHKFISAHAASPVAIKYRGLAWSPMNPLTNLEIPYVTPPKLEINPSCA